MDINRLVELLRGLPFHQAVWPFPLATALHFLEDLGDILAHHADGQQIERAHDENQNHDGGDAARSGIREQQARERLQNSQKHV